MDVAEKNRSELEILNGRRIISTVDWNGVPVATAQTRSRHSGFPPIILKDHSAGDAARMLYAFSPEDGHLIEHYKNIRVGDAQVYTVAQGFDLPRMEIYRGRYLEDEAAPSLISFGKDYGLTISVVRGRNPLSQLIGLMHERVVANGFNYAGQNLFQLTDPSPERNSQFDYSRLHHSARQAEDIRRLPTLASVLLAAQSVPWTGLTTMNEATPPAERDDLRFVLAKQHLAFPTGLIPTAPKTAEERYVRTVDEMKIVHLALKLGDLMVAREILDFYWDKAEGGRSHSTNRTTLWPEPPWRWTYAIAVQSTPVPRRRPSSRRLMRRSLSVSRRAMRSG